MKQLLDESPLGSEACGPGSPNRTDAAFTASRAQLTRAPSRKAPPRVAVIIVNYNSGDDLACCLTSLQRADADSQQLEVLVVDNASTDNSLQKARQAMPSARFIKTGRNRGFAGGNNVALRLAQEEGHDYAYLLNPDTEVSPGFLSETLRVASSDEAIAAVQSKVMLWSDKARINTIGNRMHYLGVGFTGECGKPDHPAPPGDVCFASGAAMLLRLSALAETGLFNEEFFLYQEDADLCWRLRLQGYRIVLAPQSVVYHKYAFSRSSSKFYYLERNRYLMLFQNDRLRTLLAVFPPLAAMHVGMIVHSLLNGWGREQLRLHAYFARRRNWRSLLATRRRIQAKRKTPDRDIARYWSGTIDFDGLDGPLLRYVVNPLLAAYWRLIRPVIRW